MIGCGVQAVAGEVAFLDAHLTLGAGLASAAQRLDLHAELARGFQHGEARGNITLPAGRLEDHAEMGRSRNRRSVQSVSRPGEIYGANRCAIVSAGMERVK